MTKYKNFSKIVLAYSGGLDTTVAIPWLKEKTEAEIIALGVDVGQPENFQHAIDRAVLAGADKVTFIDAQNEFATGYLLPAIQANALYEGVYPLLSALSRPQIVEKLVQEATETGADAVAHGCTGKGNDQVRFELSLAALAPDLPVLAPARHWGFTRDDSLNYAREHGLMFQTEKQSHYSIDENLWGRAIECGVLEDPWIAPPSDIFTMTQDPENAPDYPAFLTIDFQTGVPVALNGNAMNLHDLILKVGEIAGGCGVGRIDHIESRVVGIKSREVYECPGAVTLITAHKALEATVLTREELSFKAQVDAMWAQLIYEGKWHSYLKTALDAFIQTTQSRVTGSVRLKMYKGSLGVVGRRSPYSLYQEELATYGADDTFDHEASDGFLKIYTLETAMMARMKMRTAQPMKAPCRQIGS